MPTASARPTLGRTKLLVFSAITIGVIFVSGELAIRAWSYYLRDEYQKYDIATGTFVLVPGSHRGGAVRINSDGFAGADLKRDGPDLWRILAVGESTTFSGGGVSGPYSAKLGAILDKRANASRRYEVINGGIEGMDSKQISRRLQSKGLPLEPDVVLIWSGWNDLMKFDPVGQDRENRWAAVSRALDKLWLVKGLRKLIFYYVRPYLNPPATGVESRTGRFANFNPTFFIENLREMIRLVRESGAEPVLLTLLTVVRHDMTSEDLRSAWVVFPYYPSGYGVGDFLEIIDGYNRAIRRVGVEEQVPVVDLAKRFAPRPDYRSLFTDTMHTTEKGREQVATAVFEDLDRLKLLGEGAAPTRQVDP